MQAVSFIRDSDGRQPEISLILGSGLGHLAESVSDAAVFDSGEIPGYPASSVEGHHGRLIIGRLEEKTVAVIQGRLHFYEGHAVRETTFPVRLVHALGADHLIVTNAAGGINPLFDPGTIMFIVDHLNLSFQSPLAGANVDGGPRFTDMSSPYDPEWIDRAEACALQLGIGTRRGVYLWTQGPAYETKAEIRFFGRIGADAVGMSTVPEVLQARNLGMRVLGISAITNAAAGLAAGPLNHEEVLTVGTEIRSDLEKLIRTVVR
ncbi:MAG: purine-nucleoside phosphorylase, partial [Rhodothermia bacterium]|nr:purine-nucleoside phosphorylase [Rhodothermia bacterium]